MEAETTSLEEYASQKFCKTVTKWSTRQVGHDNDENPNMRQSKSSIGSHRVINLRQFDK